MVRNVWAETCKDQRKKELEQAMQYSKYGKKGPELNLNSQSTMMNDEVDFKMIESPMDLIKKAKQVRKFDELHSHTQNDNSRTLAVANSSYGRLVEHTRVAPQVTQIIRGTIKESPIHLRQLYNDPINKIKKLEMPTKDQIKLGRH